MDQCLSKYYQHGFASALMMSKHSSWAITFNGDHPVSISLCTLVADNMSKGTVFVIHVNTNQVPLKAGVLLHSTQFTDSCPQLSHITTCIAPPFLAAFSMIITHKAMMAMIITLHVSSLDICSALRSLFILFRCTNAAVSLSWHFAGSVVVFFVG